MRKFYTLFLAGLLCLFCNTYFAVSSYAQVQTARYISTGPNSNGFYEYLPAGYSSGNGKYPLLIFIHGIGELGNGTTDLPMVLDNESPPHLIAQGRFPTSFTVNGQTFSFIVISPQFVSWPSNADVNDVINYALANYRVDTGRVYLTGLSMGGGVVWAYASDPQYAGMLAGIVPIAGGNLWGGAPAAAAIANNNLPVFAAANLNDPTVPSSYTVSDVQLINSITPSITPTALDTIYNASGHGGWVTTYDPNTNLHNGLNVYQWMLQYSRNAAGPIPLPVKLTNFSATLLSGTPETQLDWTTTFEQNNHYFLIQRSTDGANFSVIDTVAATNAQNGHSYTYTDQHPVTGADYYRLAQVDLDGTTNYSQVREVFVQQQASTSTGMSLSPNPADALVYLQLGDGVSGSVEVRLLDVEGRTLRNWVFQKPEGSWSQSLDVSGLPSGSYFMQVLGTNYQAIKTFIKK